MILPSCRIVVLSIRSVRVLSTLVWLCMTLNRIPGNCRGDPLKLISAPLKNHLIVGVGSTDSDCGINRQTNVAVPPMFTSRTVPFRGTVSPVLCTKITQPCSCNSGDSDAHPVYRGFLAPSQGTAVLLQVVERYAHTDNFLASLRTHYSVFWRATLY